MEQKIKELIEKYNGYWYESDGRHGYEHGRDCILVEIENDLKCLKESYLLEKLLIGEAYKKGWHDCRILVEKTLGINSEGISYEEIQ